MLYLSRFMGVWMNKEDVRLYKQIQENAQTLMCAIDTLTEKIYDKNLSVEASREFMTFADIQNRALKKLTEDKEEGYKNSQMQDVIHRSGLQMGSLLDGSTSHVADMMIQENSKNVAKLYKNMRQEENASKECMELAEELAGFEENNMQRLKQYL